MFPDGKITKESAYKRTKIAAVIIEVLASDVSRRTVRYAVNGLMNLMMDESNDMDSEKGCVIVLR